MASAQRTNSESSTSSRPRHRAALYAFAIIVSLVALGVRQALAPQFDDHPLLILLMFPIIVSALLGGLGPGLVATLVCALGIDYVSIPPTGSLRIAATHDLLMWGMLVANGALVSILSEILHRTRRQAEIARAEQARAAARLADHEQRLRLAQDAAHAGTWEWELASGANEWSAELWPLYGLEPGVAPSYQSWRVSVHPADRERVEEMVREAAASGAEFEVEWRVNLHAEAPPRWLMARGRPLKDQAGKFSRYIGIVIDISNRKLAEQAARDSDKTYRSLFDHMLNGFAYCRMLFEDGHPVDFIYLSVNAAFESLTGLKEVVGKRVSTVIPGIRETDPQLFEVYSRVARSGVPESFETYVEALQMWFAISVYSPQPEHFVAVFDVITERKQAEAQLQASAQMLQTVIDTVPHVVFWKDRQSRYLGCNAALARMAGVASPRVMVGTSDYDYAWRDFAPLYQQDDALVMDSGIAKHNIVEPVDVGNGSVHWVETSKEPLRAADGHIFGVVGVFQDITERKRAEEKVQQAAKVFESTMEGVMVTDADTQIIAVNQAFCEITGYSEEDALGQRPRLLKSERHDEIFYRSLWASINQTGTWRGEIWNRRKGGEIYPAWLTINTVKDGAGKVSNYVGVFSDIGHIKQYEERLEFLAHHDPLTHLPNRLLLNDRLEMAIQRAKREGTALAVLFIDLDYFKKVNDGLGHPCGDQLLQTVAARISAIVRGEDTVARQGGDEFVVTLEGFADINYVTGVAEKILHTLNDPFTLEGQEVFVGASIGISTYPGDGEDSVVLLKNADAAMYRAKDGGRNTYRFYSTELTQAARDHLSLETALRAAIRNREFVLHYQPQLDVVSGRMTGVEALVRWDHPQSGLISPVRFIPFAEETGLIVPLGEWVLRAACEQLKAWLDAGLAPITVAVNLSPRQFVNRDIVEQVRGVLKDTRLPPHLLELEITEGATMERGDSAVATLTALKELGVRLAIDDFGTGYSSLAYLRRFPIDVLKIDQSFMRGIPHENGAMEIAVTIIAMARNLHMQVLAEGVETVEQLDFIRRHGCDYSQGYLHSRPVPGAEIEACLRGGGKFDVEC